MPTTEHLTRIEGVRKMLKEMREQREAEDARRASLHSLERLAEDGAKLRQQIESNDDMIAVLETSRSARAGCRAGDDCFYAPREVRIQDRYRIRVEGVRDELGADYYRTKHYYHVLCFEAMMDLEDMIPSGNFVCDAGGAWGLLVRKWFQHRGRIDEKVLVEYIRARKEWEEKHYSGSFTPDLSADSEPEDADSETEGILASGSTSSVSETNEGSQEEVGSPVLQDCVTDEGWVSLFFLLGNPEAGAGQMSFTRDPRQSFMFRPVNPWPDADEGIEAEEYGPKTEAEVNTEAEQQRIRRDEKREKMRAVWEILHPPATVDSDSLDPEDDDAEPHEGAGEGHKRRRSNSDGEESEKRRKCTDGEDIGGQA
ncbi:hypothetical protein QBC47DRAFT_389 [Echria macrotheca]|uniref:Uncharacterized protein n=1 Tax=Echria macrotheca TaxID=438768 RepID=A0AAJ0BN37_9PEZI|nr:hypothetical protein QBC47DRAFT_389 [Echria macrotheca]